MSCRTGLQLVLGLAWLGGVAIAQQASKPEPKAFPDELTLGVYTSDRATTMYVMFQPMAQVLERGLGQKLEREIRVRLRVIDGYQKAIDQLVKGEVDLARFGPASYVLAHRAEPGIALLARELVKGRTRFSGVIAVRVDSPFETLSDLQGTAFAFGDPNSTIGRFLAEAELYRAGLELSDLRHYEFLGRHDKVAKAVAIGDFDAGALKINTFEKANAGGAKLRILHRFDNVTKPWIARKGLDEKLVEALREVLLECRDREAMQRLKISGFAPAKDKDFDFVRRGMRDAATFEGVATEGAGADGSPGATPPRKDG